MRTDLRVRRNEGVVRIDLRHSGEALFVKSVDFTADDLSDDTLTVPLRVLNEATASWPNEPVTVEQVVEMAG